VVKHMNNANVSASTRTMNKTVISTRTMQMKFLCTKTMPNESAKHKNNGRRR